MGGASTITWVQRFCSLIGAKKLVESYTGGTIGKLSEAMDSYAVIDEGHIVTVGVRYSKINRV